MTVRESERRKRQSQEDRAAEQSRRDRHVHDEARLKPRVVAGRVKPSNDGVGIGQRKSIVKRADRNLRKMEKQLEPSLSQFKAAFDQLANQLGQLRDSIRARIESEQRMTASEYTRSLETTNLTRGSSNDSSGVRAQEAPKPRRSRRRAKSTRPTRSR